MRNVGEVAAGVGNAYAYALFRLKGAERATFLLAALAFPLSVLWFWQGLPWYERLVPFFLWSVLGIIAAIPIFFVHGLLSIFFFDRGWIALALLVGVLAWQFDAWLPHYERLIRSGQPESSSCVPATAALGSTDV